MFYLQCHLSRSKSFYFYKEKITFETLFQILLFMVYLLPFFHDCLISAQKIVTHILPSFQNSLQIHSSILQISVPSFSSASKSSETVAERLKTHPGPDPASEMRYYGFHVFFNCKSNTLRHLRRAIICQSLNYQVISLVNKARIPLASCSKPS